MLRFVHVIGDDAVVMVVAGHGGREGIRVGHFGRRSFIFFLVSCGESCWCIRGDIRWGKRKKERGEGDVYLIV